MMKRDQKSKIHSAHPVKKLIAVLLGLTLLTSVTILAGSQRTAAAQQELDTTMLVFDLSGSMGTTEPDGRTRLAIAQQAMIDAIGGIDPGSKNIGIRSFSDCGVTQLEYAPSPVDQASLAATINSFTPDAQTDIAAALNGVASDFAGTSGRPSVVLLSDGAHNCGGDPCVTAANLIAAGIDIIVHAIGIGTEGTDAEAQLACIATVTGGTVVSVASADELFDAIDNVITGDPTSALVRTARATCVTSSVVQNDDSLGALRVGTTFSDSNGVDRVLVTGEDCDFDCNAGFDMNCDGVNGDFCPSEFDRKTVAGAGKCLEVLDGDSDDDSTDLATICGGASASLTDAEVAACEFYTEAQLFQERADDARATGDAFLADFNQQLADDRLARAQNQIAKAGA